MKGTTDDRSKRIHTIINVAAPFIFAYLAFNEYANGHPGFASIYVGLGVVHLGITYSGLSTLYSRHYSD